MPFASEALPRVHCALYTGALNGVPPPVSTTNPQDTFHPFPRLPIELQLEVFKQIIRIDVLREDLFFMWIGCDMRRKNARLKMMALSTRANQGDGFMSDTMFWKCLQVCETPGEMVFDACRRWAVRVYSELRHASPKIPRWR